MAIGYANGLNIVASTNTFTKDSDGNVLFELNLSTKNLAALISGKDYVDDLTIEIELTRNKQISTLLQFPVVIFNNAISSAPTVEQIPFFDSYKNACETAKLAAETAKAQAQESATSASASEANAATSATTARTAAETAEQEATAAILAKDQAEAAQTASETAKTAAQASADKAKASETKVEQSAQAAAVNAQAAEFSKSYAESYANTAQTAATTAEQEATSANIARDDAYLAQVGAETAKTAAETANTQAQAAKQAAVDAANTATQAAGIQAIRQEMLAKGYLHCTAGGYAAGSFTGAGVLSVIFKTNADFSSRADDNILSFFLLGVYQNGFDMQLGDDHVCRLRRNSSGFRSFTQTAVAAKATNEINIVCAVFKKLEDGNADGTLYVNGSVISPMTTTEGVYPTFGNKYYVNNVSGTQGGRTKTYVGYQDFMIFNFDIFAEGAPYSYADYANGNLVPPALKDTTATNRALLMLENYTILNGSSRFIPDVSGNGQDATVGTNYGGTISGDVDVSIAKLKEYLTANS